MPASKTCCGAGSLTVEGISPTSDFDWDSRKGLPPRLSLYVIRSIAVSWACLLLGT